MKKLGFGTMRLPLKDANDAGSVDIDLFSRMTDTFLERGFTYFDTAWMYHDEKSEAAVREALIKRHPREFFTITDKFPAYFLTNAQDRDRIFNTQFERLGVDYLDYYWLHDINSKTLPTFRKFGCFDWIHEKKAQGLVKNIGFSFHDSPELLDRLLTENPDFEYVQLQLNYLDWLSLGVQSKACHDVAVKHGKKILVMEPAKGGTLASVPAKAEAMFRTYDPNASIASWAIRFAASQENVMMVLSGMSNMEQLLDNTAYMADFKPLTEEEQTMCFKAAEIINEKIVIPCTGCSYCTSNCPMKIAIPRYFSIYNAEMQEKPGKGWTPQIPYYNNTRENFGKPEECIGCGQCEAMCPQHLHIRDLLKDVYTLFKNKG